MKKLVVFLALLLAGCGGGETAVKIDSAGSLYEAGKIYSVGLDLQDTKLKEENK